MEKRREYNNLSELMMQHYAQREALWTELIEASDITEPKKHEVRSIIQFFLQNATTRWHSIDDAVYGTIHKLLGATEKEAPESEATALFENLRDDLLQVQQEAREEYLA